MILHDASLYQQEGRYHIVIEKGRIQSIHKNSTTLPANAGPGLYLEGALVLPGFINSHDHLDFNLFPQLGKGGYSNYRQWGPAIQAEHQELIEKVKKIPPALRTAWGQYRNLINGFTTVVNHGSKLEISPGTCHVFQDVDCLHSPGFEKRWQWKLNNPLRLGSTVVIHAGEGIDEVSAEEVEELVRYNYFRRPVVAVHGVAMNVGQAKHFKALVWCPGSNYFMFDRTAPVAELSENTSIVFGTDSTLTAPWNAWVHFRQALNSVSEQVLINMLTADAAKLWKFKDRGVIKEGMIADLLVIKNNSPVFQNNPSDILAVFSNGKACMIDAHFHNATSFIEDAAVIQLGDAVKLLPGDFVSLQKKLRQYFIFPNPLEHA